MGLITDKRFYSLEKLEEGKGVIYILDDKTLLKKTEEDMLPFIHTLMKFKIDKLGLPLEIYRVVLSSCYLYSMPYFPTFHTLDNFSEFEKNFSDKEVLIFYRKLIEKVEEIHSKGLASGDMHAGNILIDENLDYRFIDFDYATTEKHTGHMVECGPLFLENYDSIVLNSNYSIKSQIELSDKMYLWNLILNCMIDGTFLQGRSIETITDFSELSMPFSIEKKLNRLFTMDELPRNDDYFLEELDTLIKLDYKLPYRKKK